MLLNETSSPPDPPTPSPSNPNTPFAVPGASDSLAYAVDPRGRITRFNPACEQLSGYSFAEVQAIPFWEVLIPPEVRESVSRIFLEMVASRQVQAQVTLEWLARSGQRRLIFWRNKVETGPDGSIQEILSTGQDISETAALEEQVNLLSERIANGLKVNEQIIAAIPMGFEVFRADGACVIVNEAACRILRASREQMLAQNFRRLETWKQNGLLKAADEVLAGGPQQTLELHPVSTPGPEVWLLCRISSFQIDGNAHLLLIFDDIAEQRQAEARLRRQAEQQALLAELSELMAETAAEPERLLQVTTERIGASLGELCLLFLIREDQQTIQPLAFYHADPELRAGLWSLLSDNLSRVGEGFIGQVLQMGQARVIADLSQPEALNQVLERNRSLLKSMRIRSMVAVPLRVRGQIVGGLVVGRTSLEPRFTPEDVSLVQLLADRAALGISNARLYAENLRHKAELEQRVAERTAELRQSEQTLRSLLDAIPEIAFLMAPDGRILSGNQALARGFGRPLDQLIGLNIYHLLPEPLVARRKSAMDQVVQTRTPATLEDDFTGFFFSSRIYPVSALEGKVTALAVLSINVTEQQRLMQELRDREERFRAVFEQAGVGITLTAADGRYLRVNPRFCEITGYSEAELLERDYQSITYPPDLAANLALNQRVQRGEIRSFTIEKRYLRKDGRLICVNITSHQVHDPSGTLFYSVAIVEDISERKKAQALLEERTRELARSNADLEQFAYIASHDLQEPLRMISGFSQLIAKRYQGRLDPDADEFIRYITDGVQHMQRLINDLLAYSRVGRRSRPFAQVSMENALAQAMDNLQIRIEESGARLTHDSLPVVRGDETQMIQLLQNLIENSLKFRSKVPPHVHISARLKDGAWQFSVRDNGIGIEPQYFERIFIIFQRLHLREEYPGTGLGLAICKKIVERHGGRIWVESEVGHGSTFYFSLPERPGDEAAPAAPHSQAGR